MLVVMLALVQRFEHGCAKGRGQDDGHQHRQRHRRDDGGGELPVDHTGRSAKKGHRHEYRRQHQADGDQCTGDLAHRFPRRFDRRQTLLCHQAFDIFDHDDRVIDQQSDGQHHREHRQHVDRETQHGEHPEGTQQHHGDRDGRNQRGAEILQEQIHHQEHQDDRFQQDFDDILDRHPHERRGFERNDRAQTRREERLEFLEPFFNGLAVSRALAPVASITAMPVAGCRL